MIPVSQPDIGALERRYLLEAFDSGWISSLGDFIARAEGELREVTGAPHVAVCNNGTTALHLALLAAGVKAGDEVVIPSLTYIATLNAVYYVGAVPRIVDVDPDTWCIDPAAVRAAMSDRTTAIIGVDLYGQPANYEALRAIADAHEVALIADAAESIGASLNGVPTGSLADISTFSFFGNKTVTSGEGGAVASRDASTHATILQLRNQGNHATRRYFHEVVGFNYRMTNLSAAVLTAQLERMSELVGRREVAVAGYDQAFQNIDSLLPQSLLAGAVRSPWMYSVRIVGASAAQRDSVMDAMRERGIETRPVFVPVQHMPFVPDEHRVETPAAQTIAREGLSLPTYSGISDADVQQVVTTLIDCVSSLDVANG